LARGVPGPAARHVSRADLGHGPAVPPDRPGTAGALPPRRHGGWSHGGAVVWFAAAFARSTP